MNGKVQQIIYSKTKICDALFELLNNNSFDELTVNEILDVSQISRRTFYRYFNNKEDIIHYYYNDLIEQYRQLKENILKQTSFNQMLLVTLDFFGKNREQLALLGKNDKLHYLLEKFNEVSIDIYKNVNAPWHINSDATPPILYFIIGGYFNIIIHWIQEENPQPPEKIALDIQQLFAKINQQFSIK